MIVVRHSVIVDEPVQRAGFLWADFVAHRISDRDFTPDEWIRWTTPAASWAPAT